MKKLFIALAMFACVFASCDKEPDTITLITNHGGNIIIKLVSDDNTPIARAKVAISSTVTEGTLIYYDSTNNEGICDPGRMLEGQYEYIVTAYKGKLYFEKYGTFQVIGGDSKTVEINPFAEITKATFTIVDYYNQNPLTDVRVALIPHSSYYNFTYTFDSLMNEAYYTETTDLQGQVTFNEVPYTTAAGQYSVMVYRDNGQWNYPSIGNTFFLSSNQPNIFTVRADI